MNIRHSELILSLTQTPGYFVTTRVLQPGKAPSFPWLAGIANNFEYYKVKSISYRLKPTTGTETSGTNAMAFDYDVLDAPPATYPEFMSAQGAVSTSAYSPLSLKLDTKAIHQRAPRLYTLPGAAPQGSDERLYDGGSLQVVAFNSAAGAVLVPVADLYVDYEIDFFTPQKLQVALLAAYAVGDTTTFVQAVTEFAGLSSNPIAAGVIPTIDKLRLGATDALGYVRLIQDGLYSVGIDANLGRFNGTAAGTWLQANVRGINPTTSAEYDVSYARGPGDALPASPSTTQTIAAKAGTLLRAVGFTSDTKAAQLVIQAGCLFYLTYLGQPSKLLSSTAFSLFDAAPTGIAYVIANDMLISPGVDP
jgi:hypothetical protein